MRMGDTEETAEGEEDDFEEKCNHFMRDLQKYYDKYLKDEAAFVKKSYLESNMFSSKRRTIEDIISKQRPKPKE